MNSNRSVRVWPAKQGAFTLVELLVVMAILGVLAGLVLAVLGRVRSRTRITVCTSNMRQMGMAFHTFAADGKGRLPVQKSSGVWYKDAGSWSYQLFPYTRSYEITACPEAAIVGRQEPGVTWPPKATFNYNSYVSTAAAETYSREFLRLEESKNPSRDILMLDGRANNRGLAQAPVIATACPSTSSEFYPHVSGGHPARTVLFADGHVRVHGDDLSYIYWQWPLQ